MVENDKINLWFQFILTETGSGFYHLPTCCWWKRSMEVLTGSHGVSVQALPAVPSVVVIVVVRIVPIVPIIMLLL